MIRDPKPSAPQTYSYFQPGQVLFLVSHKNEQLTGDQIDQLMSWSNELAKAREIEISRRLEPELRFKPVLEEKDARLSQAAETGSSERIKRTAAGLGASLRSSPRLAPKISPRNPFSLIPFDVRSAADPSGRVLEDSKLVELVLDLDDKRASYISRAPGEEITLEAVVLNWLASPGSEFGGGGGPGSRPVPYTGPAGSPPYKFMFSAEIQDLLPRMSDERGAGVKVAILDTAPCLQDLVAAYERWQPVDASAAPAQPHGLIETLLKPDGPLTVHPASYEQLIRMRGVSLKDHDYGMADHGLFVAGIIHSIAPAAEIHLYEVLNRQGVGDLQTIASGLQKASELEGALIVVNCSLVLNIPLINQKVTDLDPAILSRLFKPEAAAKNAMGFLGQDSLSDAGLEWLERQGLVLDLNCQKLYARGSRVVASAGNDRVPGLPTPQARFPAAFESVVGVGALPKQEAAKGSQAVLQTAAGILANPLSSYSNWADKPERVGVTTLGGEPGDGQGVLGVYVGEFPPDPNPSFLRALLNRLIVFLGGTPGGPKNERDWAWWAGTSFAAPILTGLIAAILSRPGEFTTVQQAIEKMYAAGAILDMQPQLAEDRLPEVRQIP